MVVCLQMAEQVQKNRVGRIAGEEMPVVAGRAARPVENMAEEVFAERLQQLILGFEVRVKGGTAHIRLRNDLAHGDLPEILVGKKSDQCGKDRLPCFSLPSVHECLRTFFRNCSVRYIAADLHLVFAAHTCHSNE